MIWTRSLLGHSLLQVSSLWTASQYYIIYVIYTALVCVLFVYCLLPNVLRKRWRMQFDWWPPIGAWVCVCTSAPDAFTPPPPPHQMDPPSKQHFLLLDGGLGGSPSPTGVCHPGCVRIKKRCADLTMEHRGTRRPTQSRSCTGGLEEGEVAVPPSSPSAILFPCWYRKFIQQRRHCVVFYFLHVELGGQREIRLKSSEFSLTGGAQIGI